ncbi:unnamed protein product [Gongylonema pulchrum]|uniref:DUF2428 domain-containing protein n=1 Tax=Gongylonema pulchrum TaxID=637853 RepID=A0A183E4N3_9BILA|nr:unnamed protein product [Gongylonema pulchrum]
MFGYMSDLISRLVVACEDPSLSSQASHISTFIHFFNVIVSQCMTGDYVDENQDANVEKCLIFGMHRRAGIYRYKMDGNLFDRNDAIQQLAAVARSVALDALLGTDLIKIKSSELPECYAAMRDAWKNFCSYLVLNNQILLAICTRSSFSLLPCYVAANQVDMVRGELRSTTELLMERILSQSNADLELCVILLFAAPATDIKENTPWNQIYVYIQILVRTRSWAVKCKSPHVMLSLIRLAKFCAIVLGDDSTFKQLNHYYALNFWIKKLGKFGAICPSQHGALDTTVQEFVRCRVPVEVLNE